MKNLIPLINDAVENGIIEMVKQHDGPDLNSKVLEAIDRLGDILDKLDEDIRRAETLIRSNERRIAEAYRHLRSL